MPNPKPGILLRALLAVVFGFLATTNPLFAATREKVLHSFGPGKGGHSPWGVIFDAAGNLYGATSYGGAHQNAGTVFELTPSANGKWTETVLYNFCSVTNCLDGEAPFSGLIFDAVGNLYGTTVGGGTGGFQAGTVFRLAPDGKGNWIETVLHNFGNDQDGLSPFAGVVMDAGGNLYGTTTYGGSAEAGIAFQLSPNGDGSWTETVLHNFCSAGCTDGENPYGPLTLDAAGNVYGTTSSGGNIECFPQFGCGTVFKLTPGANGEWTETVLHAFDSFDGAAPSEGLIFDTAGNLYGTTPYGGRRGCDPSIGCGIVFELIPGADGKWTEKVLFTFYKYPKNPLSPLVFDAAGNLYGTTSQGGRYGDGTLFKLAPGVGGWTQTSLYSFHEQQGNGPRGPLVFDSSGNLYGSTLDGGKFSDCEQSCGVVFKIEP